MSEPIEMLTDPQLDALSSAVVALVEIVDPALRDAALAAINPAVLATALLFVETDPDFAPRWAASDDWIDRASLLHEAITFLVTPGGGAIVSTLPTFEEMRRRARAKLSDARDELNSDWREGSGPNARQAEALHKAMEHIAAAKGCLDAAAER